MIRNTKSILSSLFDRLVGSYRAIFLITSIGLLSVLLAENDKRIRLYIIVVLLSSMTLVMSYLWSYYLQLRHESASPWALESALYEWIIHDKSGRHATLRKVTSGICRGNSIAYIQETCFGSGDPPKLIECSHSAGDILEIYSIESRHHVFIRLYRAYNRGDKYNFIFQRKIADAFISQVEWVAVTSENRSNGPLRIRVIFPNDVEILGAKIRSTENGIHRESSLIFDRDIYMADKEYSGPRIEYSIGLPLPGASFRIEWEWSGGSAARQ